MGVAAAETPRNAYPLIGLRLRDEQNPLACQYDTTKVFPIIVQRKSFVPKTRNPRERAAEEPHGRVHPEVVSELDQHEFQRVQVLAQGVGDEPRFPGAVIKGAEGGRKQGPGVGVKTRAPELLLDLIGCEEIVRIQPLDEIALRMREGMVSRRTGAPVFLREHLAVSRFKCPGRRQGIIPGTIIDDDDLLVGPGLRKGGLDGLADPFLGVVCGDQDGYKGMPGKSFPRGDRSRNAITSAWRFTAGGWIQLITHVACEVVISPLLSKA
jgi:hypothetical protein